MIKILCIIPARSGSKSLHHKNIKIYKGLPLLAWSILHAKLSKFSDHMKIVVSTDSQTYQQIAIEYGAEVPCLRPPEISNDHTIDYEFMKYTVDWLKKHQDYSSDIILQLRPTSPTRKVLDIDNALECFIENRDVYDSLRSVVEVEKTPYKMYNIIECNLCPLFTNIGGMREPYNQCRQSLPKCYLHNGYIDILNTSLLEQGTISGRKILPYIMDVRDTNDIDTENDFKELD
jgi:N-acylneuraminate cytidylyltransferase